MRVLSTQLTAKGHVISGHDTESGGTYVFDYDHSDFQLVGTDGGVTTHYAQMKCVLCPADQDRCPGN